MDESPDLKFLANTGLNNESRKEGAITDTETLERTQRKKAEGFKKVGLEQLPAEILQEIVRFTVSPCCSCAEWNRSRRQLCLRDNPFAFADPQLQVSLVSKTLSRVSRPIVYETVYLSDKSKLERFSSMLMEQAVESDTRRDLGVEAQWVRRVVVHLELGRPRGDHGLDLVVQSFKHLVAIFTICTKIQSIKFRINGVGRAAKRNDFQHHLLSLWNAMPCALRSIHISNDSFIPQMSSSDQEQFAANHPNISMVYIGYPMRFDTSLPLGLFPQLTRLGIEETRCPQTQPFQNMNWSSLTWISAVKMYLDIADQFWDLQFDSLVSLELGRYIHFKSRQASLLFSRAPNLEELQFSIDDEEDDFEVGWGSYNEATGHFVKHPKLKHLEILLWEWDPFHLGLAETDEERRRVMGIKSEAICRDFRSFTMKDFPSLKTLDVFVDVYVASFAGPDVFEALQEVLQINIGAAIDSSVQLAVAINDRIDCGDRVHHMWL